MGVGPGWGFLFFGPVAGLGSGGPVAVLEVK